MEQLTAKKYNQSEMGLIPEDWKNESLGEIIDLLTDFTANGSFASLAQNVEYLDKPSHARLIRLTDIRVKFKNNGIYISKDAYNFLSKSKLFGTELLLANVGAYTGYSFLYPEGLPFRGSLGPNMFLIKFKERKVDPLFVFYCFDHYTILNQLLAKAASSAQPKLNKQNVRECIISFPSSIEEQKAIAKVLSDTDALIQALEKKIVKKKLIKKGVMQRLLTPKEGWDYIRLGDIATMNSGGTPLTSNEKFYNGKIVWVSISDISESGKYISNSSKKISEEGLTNSSARLFKAGTVLLAMYASIGKCCIATKEVSTSQAILGITPSNQLINEYLYYYLIFKVEDLINQGQQGTQSNLNKGIVEDYKLHLPSLEGQKEIAQILSDMDKEIQILEQKLSKYQLAKQGMMQQLLTGKIRLV